MDKLTAARILGVEYDSSIEDIRAAFRAKTEEINLEDNPQEFALIQTAYRTLTRSAGGAGLSLPGDTGTVFHADEDLSSDEMDDAADGMDDPGIEYAEGEETLFAGIVEEETAKDREEYDRQKARETFAALLQLPKSSYDYVQLLEIARKCDLRWDECKGIAKQLTAVRNLIRRGDNRVRRTKGFDEFVGYLYSRMGKTFYPMVLRLKYLVAILVAVWFLAPAVFGILVGLYEEFAKMPGVADKASLAVTLIMLVVFFAGIFFITKKTGEMRIAKRNVIIVIYIVLFIAFDLFITLLVYNMLS